MPMLLPSPVVGDATACQNAEEVGEAAAVLSSLSAIGPAPVADTPREHAAKDAGDGKRHLVEMLSQEDLEHRVMQRGVRIVFVGQEYSNVHYLIRQRARRASASVHHFPSNQISRKFTSHELDRIPREAFELPPKAVVDALLAAYFRHVHPGFPVLDKPAFMEQYRRRDPANPLSLLVLQAVLMVGAHVFRGGGGNMAAEGEIEAEPEPATEAGGHALLQDRAALKAAFFRRAKMLFDARFEWNRDVVVQAALLMMWHSEGVEDIGANSYYWVGVAARTALGLGMHRDTRASTLVAHDKRLWRRLWWLLVQFDVIVSLSYGRPMAIDLAESDVPELAPDELADTATRDGRREDGGIDGAYLIHQMRLSCIIARTLRDRFGLNVPADRRRQALADADQRLAVWMARLPAPLRCRPDGTAASPWCTMLHLTYNNVLILLHRPPPTPTPSACADASSQGQENMGICSAAAGAIVSLLEAVAARGELRFLNVFAVDALLTTLIQLSAEIRMANPILAGHAMQRFDSAMDILRRLSGVWLNAEIILRLFEDSSELTRAELLIGKARPAPTTNGDAEADETPAAVTMPLPVLSAMQPQLVPMDEQLDWTSLYWENSGFSQLSPFSEMPMYLL